MLILKILAAPFVLVLTLLAAIITFLACIGLTLLAIVALIAGQTTGCIAVLVLAFLVSPFGLPAIGEWLVGRLHGAKYALQDFITG